MTPPGLSNEMGDAAVGLRSKPEEIWCRLKDRPDDDETWQWFFKVFQPVIFSEARRRGFSVADADDIVQETMLVLTREVLRPEQKRGRSAVQLALAIARNKISDFFRRGDVAKRLNRHSLQWYFDSKEPHTERQLEILGKAVERVRDRATPGDFEMFSLSVLQGRSRFEVARLLGKSTKSVYSAVARVKLMIRADTVKLAGCDL